MTITWTTMRCENERTERVVKSGTFTGQYKLENVGWVYVDSFGMHQVVTTGTGRTRKRRISHQATVNV